MSKSKFAVFDIDGTLIRWQLYHAFYDQLSKNALVDESEYEQIKQLRMNWKNRTSLNAFTQYELALVKSYTSALPNIPPEIYDRIAQNVAESYKSQVYSYTRDLAKNLKSKGYKLIAISGSPKKLLDFVAPVYGFDIWKGSEFELKDGKFTGKTNLTHDRKGEILKNLIEKNQLDLKDSYGIGDTLGDKPILEIVENPIAFNPVKGLLDLAVKNNWKVVIERKNVVYELNNLGSKQPAVTIH
jgi:HAD superfamily hydrolase (TIGR01490 family)